MHARAPRTIALITGVALITLAGCGQEQVMTPPTDGTVAVADTAPRTAGPRAWEHQRSDIPVDTRIKFGHFDNGLRYAWAANSEPKKRCYIRLHVDVGSLGETDEEQGMAHFLEHMAFNGTKNFAPGTLIEWFQENGMAFGADTNAHTAFSETVYKLDLPENDPETIREGLKVLRDFADGMLLNEEEVQAEKGVIDGEQRERDSAQFRMRIKELDIVFAGTLLAERIPIGTKEVRDTFTAAKVRAFYERWYRPENMTLVAVGDFGDLDPVALFEEAFADMPVPAAPLVAEPEPGKPASYSHFYSIYEKEIPQVQIGIARLREWEDEPTTVAEWVEDLPLQYAYSMLNLRFSELAKKDDTPFMSARASGLGMFESIEGESLGIRAAPEKWEAALAVSEQELRRALQHGFQPAELDEVRANALRGLDEAVEREATASSQALLRRILRAAEQETVPTTAETRRNILKPAVEALTVQVCHDALKAAWSTGELSIDASGNIDLGENAGEVLRAAYEASAKVPVEARKAVDTDAFAYASDASKSGTVADRSHVEDLDIHLVRFENGVALNLKRTEFRENQIVMSVQFGEGALTLDPKDALVLQMVGPAVVNGGGLAAHTTDDLRRLTAGKQTSVGFSVSADRFLLRGRTTAEDLLLQCELACAYLQAPGWREDGLGQMRRQIPMMYESMKVRHQGPAMMNFMPALYSGDPRYGFPEREKLEASGADEVRTWLEPILADAPIEISMVGDLDVDATIAMVARTFGTLPKRRDWKPFDERRVAPAPKSGLAQKHTIATQVPKSLVLIAFPTTDGIEMLRRRKLNMLNRVVSDRLRIEVREKLGAAYSPRSQAQVSSVHPGVGILMMRAMADPDKVDALVSACLAVGDSLAKDGLQDEELDRIREPILKQRRDAKRTNRFWMQVLGRAQSEPGHLDDIRAGDAFYEGVTAADLTPLAAEYLKSERASTLVVSPEPNE